MIRHKGRLSARFLAKHAVAFLMLLKSYSRVLVHAARAKLLSLAVCNRLLHN